MYILKTHPSISLPYLNHFTCTGRVFYIYFSLLDIQINHMCKACRYACMIWSICTDLSWNLLLCVLPCACTEVRDLNVGCSDNWYSTLLDDLSDLWNTGLDDNNVSRHRASDYKQFESVLHTQEAGSMLILKCLCSTFRDQLLHNNLSICRKNCVSSPILHGFLWFI